MTTKEFDDLADWWEKEQEKANEYPCLREENSCLFRTPDKCGYCARYYRAAQQRIDAVNEAVKIRLRKTGRI